MIISLCTVALVRNRDTSQFSFGITWHYGIPLNYKPQSGNIMFHKCNLSMSIFEKLCMFNVRTATQSYLTVGWTFSVLFLS